nr:hypothetical protein [Ignavibacteria bacterium]
MKKLIFTFSFIMFFAVSSFSQWTEQTSGVTTPIYSVSAVDNSVVWACGNGGVVLRTINSGVTWSVTTSPNSSAGLYTIEGI